MLHYILLPRNSLHAHQLEIDGEAAPIGIAVLSRKKRNMPDQGERRVQRDREALRREAILRLVRVTCERALLTPRYLCSLLLWHHGQFCDERNFDFWSRIESLREEITLIQNQERFYAAPSPLAV
jgi:hypothetical protein